MVKLNVLSDEALIAIVASALPHSDQKPEDLLWAANAFVAAHRARPGGLTVEVGTRSGGSALCWLRLIEALYPGPFLPSVFSVDPYGRKPYVEYEQDTTMRYGDSHYLDMKRLLAPFANHAHFLLDSRAFFTLLVGEKLWRDAGENDGKNWTVESRFGEHTTFVFLDGDHTLEGIEGDLDAIYPWRAPACGGWRPVLTVIDNVVHKDPRVMPMLQSDWDVVISPSGIQALVRGRRSSP